MIELFIRPQMTAHHRSEAVLAVEAADAPHDAAEQHQRRHPYPTKILSVIEVKVYPTVITWRPPGHIIEA
jgi:hypothetical protein